MTVQIHEGRHDTYDQSVDIALDAFVFPESHQLALDLPGQRASELEGVALATTE